MLNVEDFVRYISKKTVKLCEIYLTTVKHINSKCHISLEISHKQFKMSKSLRNKKNGVDSSKRDACIVCKVFVH